jgi:hypothetical protein
MNWEGEKVKPRGRKVKAWRDKGMMNWAKENYLWKERQVL